jgi:paraquat-inducible protein A
MSMSIEAVVACHECDALHRLPPLPDRAVARCRRCGATLRSVRRDSIEVVLALSIAALVMFAVANTFPFMTIELSGQRVQSSLASGVAQLWQQGHAGLATLVLFTTILAPGLQVGLMLYVTAPVFAGRLPWGARSAFRAVRMLRPWGMAEVFLLAVIISVVKLGDLGEVIPGIALWGLAGLVLLLAAAAAVLEPRQLWARMEAGR